METTILITGRDPLTLTLIGDLLRAHDYRVAERRLEGGLAPLVADCDPDLVVLDIPFAADRQLAAMVREAALDRPVVAVVQSSRDCSEGSVLRAGCTACLAKPIDIEQLLTAVANSLNAIEAAAVWR